MPPGYLGASGIIRQESWGGEMQGLNIRVTIHRMNPGNDDASGGAMITGTAAYNDIRARISARRPTQQFLEQGLEVNRLFDLIVNTQGLTINERDEVEVTSPASSPYYRERFRVMGMQHDSRHPGIGHTEFTLSRIERSRSRQ